MAEVLSAGQALVDQFLRQRPIEAALELERLPADAMQEQFARQPRAVQAQLWEQLSPDRADTLLGNLDPADVTELVPMLDAGLCARALTRLDNESRSRILSGLPASFTTEFERLISYPAGSAGRAMDQRPAALRGELSVEEARSRLKGYARGRLRQIYLLNDDGGVDATVDIQDLALAPADQPLSTLGRVLNASVSAIDTGEEISAVIEATGVEELPVLDVQQRLVGVIHARALMRSLKDSALADMQTMVGVSQEERALSPVLFAVKRRIFWMHINLLTAFLAASVVGLFEQTIAQFTALAVLLPVVAGQSGNAGAQALAVTMRGLALREISIHQWLRLLNKEALTGLLNGVAVALSTAVGVYFWSRSTGLALVIGVSMVLSMTIACMAGALVPMILTRLRQDPATSSSIVLTTVTDVAGFFSFLGIATALSGLLVAP